MLRYRRYRVFVAFAVISLVVLYHFGSSSASWRNGTPKRPKAPAAPSQWNPQLAHETKKLDLDVPIARASPSLRRPPPIAPASRPVDNSLLPGHQGLEPAERPLGIPEDSVEDGDRRGTAAPSATSIGPVHWKKQSELFPIPSSEIINLPTGKPKPIPKIQHAFKQESAAAKADREQKLGTIREVFKRSWDGYRDYAWLQDELRPVSGNFRNPFASWGATLVDALDTLWIMGMREEFDEAARAVDKIDFTTTPRNDIPLFETTIRYLGGLLAAYDVSGGKYENLLNKAVELAEVLISAFDTPNRMPETYYYWSRARIAASEPVRASSSVVLAEIGSLSVEFTRLAQLTGEQKYYDAIARITDNLEDFQNKTRLPGMWPTKFDASGCKRIDYSVRDQTASAGLLGDELQTTAATQPTTIAEAPSSPNGGKNIPLDLPAPIVFVPGTATAEAAPTVASQRAAALRKRQQLEEKKGWHEEDSGTATLSSSVLPPSSTPTRPMCEEQGFVQSNSAGSEEYTLGGMSDSTYEYLPKEWLLLGAQVDKYRTMYEEAIEVVKKNLLFRPMVPGDDDILFSGKLLVGLSESGHPELEAENAHLTCFAGGMFGMGAKIFNRPDDLDIAKKLTEGCIWSYDMTATGIMPEAFISVPCKSMEHCKWNETKYWDVVDPYAESRLESYERQMKTYEEQMVSASAWYEAELAAMTAAPTPVRTALTTTFEAVATPTLDFSQVARLETGLKKRQLAADPEAAPDPKTVPGWRAPERKLPAGVPLPEAAEPPTPVQPVQSVQAETSAIADPTLPEFPVIYSPAPPLTHEEYVKRRIENERLPLGVTELRARSYILRPEAIESVWYMYRITGDQHWREAGWRMFEAVNNHTATTYGNSAIDDVTRKEPTLNDEMESFWLAETLKYFYLLFAEEDVISLDEWVLNTEAHPFRRPK